jgi:hypothetical protein
MLGRIRQRALTRSFGTRVNFGNDAVMPVICPGVSNGALYCGAGFTG